MAKIINIEDYLKKRTETQEESAKRELRESLEAMGTWGSKEEQIKYYMDLADEDRKEWIE